MTTNALSASNLLHSGLDTTWRKLYARPLKRCYNEYRKWSRSSQALEAVDPTSHDAVQLLLYLRHQLDQQFKLITQLQARQQQFNHDYHRAIIGDERREHLIAVAKFLGYPSRIIRAAGKSKLPWFDDTAVSEQFEKMSAEYEQYITFLIDRLCEGTRRLLASTQDAQTLRRYWDMLSLPQQLAQSLQYQGQDNIRIAACKGLRKVLQELSSVQLRPIPGDIIRYVYRVSLDNDMHIWMRAEMMALIAANNPDQYADIFDRIMAQDGTTDLFLKGRMVSILLSRLPPDTALSKALHALHDEPSEYVRQRFAHSMHHLPADTLLRLGRRFMTLEPSAKVKAQFLLTLLSKDWSASQLATILRQCVRMLKQHNDSFLIRTAFHVMPQLISRNTEALASLAPAVDQVNQQLTQLNTHHDDSRVRRWAAECREAIFYVSSAARLSAAQQQSLLTLPLQDSLKLPLNPQQLDEASCRQLAYLANQRFGFNAKMGNKHTKVWAGFKFRPRLWRILHELRTPATDKRQNHNHIKGRVYYGLQQFNTRLVAEQSITKVPGEPVYISAEGGERAYLPLVDQLLSCLDQGWPTAPMQLYSSEGITEILPPSSLFKRLRARSAIQWQFAKLSRLRNWQTGDSFEPTAYLKKVSQLGFKISIRGYADTQGDPYPVDPRVQQFFPAVALPIATPTLSDAYNYFYSVYQNTIGQLLLFTSVFFTGFLANHIRQLVALRRHRKRIPLVIGGWGTRGKSGTERLKAAVLNELGLSVLSKTTGCEAMFLFGNANRSMKEMFLFRPYDKATIWEQVFLTKFSAQLGVDVFLWECMGLTPRYIEILQSQWMRDDISTITNCYPDHEDIQGPAGIEIPIVMQNFISKNGDVYTSEESMLPVLQDAAQKKNASLKAITWLQAGLITNDVLSRFPYAEHPNNIALVASMAERLGVANDVAVKAMADRVIADLGVLKIYPQVPVQGRKLEFINGMSANERLGALGNWQRTGLEQHSLSCDPEIWTSIVVNNRADRVARSQVFAAMLVNDIQADRYYFIGNNLDGLQNYIHDAWKDFADQFLEAANNAELEQKWIALCAKFRICTSKEAITKRLQTALSEQALTTEQVTEVVSALTQCADTAQFTTTLQQLGQQHGLTTTLLNNISDWCGQMLTEYWHWQTLCDQHKLTDPAAAEAILAWVFDCFKQRWVVVENYYSTGNETVQTIIDNTAIGLQTRIIGVQNIKGTGLDFVYRWQAWDKVHSYATTLRDSRNSVDVQNAARALATWQEYGVLDNEFIMATLEQAKSRQICQQESIQADLTIAEQQLKRQLKATDDNTGGSSIDSGWRYRVISAIEAFLDSGDAIKRRKRAHKVYRAILQGVISMERAAVELAELNKAQKGGWLIKTLKRSPLGTRR